MKKIFIYLLAMTTLASCAKPSKESHNQTQASVDENLALSVIRDIYYVKDHKTGLCFAVVYSGRGSAITCVPCDSLKKIALAEADSKN